MNAPPSPRIRVGWLIDGTGDRILKDATLLIRDDRIERIEPFETDRLPAILPEARCAIDLSGCTVIPCLADSHVHLCLSGQRDTAFSGSAPPAADTGMESLIQRHLAAHLERGVLAVRDGGDSAGHTLRYRRRMSRFGQGPRTVVSACRAWHRAGRYGKMIGTSVKAGRSLAEAVAAHSDGTDHVKIIGSGLNSLRHFGKLTPAQFNTPELSAAVEAARALGMKTMIHANGPDAVRSAISAGCDSIEHGFFMGRENLKRLADRAITWVPTTVTMKAYTGLAESSESDAEGARRNLDHQMEQLHLAAAWGVRVATGTDSGSPGVCHGRSLADEIELLATAGFSLPQVIRCASLNGTELMQLTDLGALSAGKRAIFLAIEGPPERLVHQLKAGRVIIWDSAQKTGTSQ